MLRLQQSVEGERRVNEVQLQRRCDSLVQKYRRIAEEATENQADQHQKHQFQLMERMKQDAAERRAFEKKVMHQAEKIVAQANSEASKALLRVEAAVRDGPQLPPVLVIIGVYRVVCKLLILCLDHLLCSHDKR